MKTKRVVVAGAVLAGAVGVGLGWFVHGRGGAGVAVAPREVAAAASVAASAQEVRIAATGDARAAAGAREIATARHAGVTAGAPDGGKDPVTVQAEANARSVVEAARTGDHPERLSAMVAGRAFDRAAFEADPRAYLDVVEPGRVWQTAEGAPGVKTLAASGVAYKEVDPGGSVVLEVTGAAGAPVTFTSFDMGAFENKLATITVLADRNGVARAVFTATEGTVESVNILAGSPMAVGQARFLVQVSRG